MQELCFFLFSPAFRFGTSKKRVRIFSAAACRGVLGGAGRKPSHRGDSGSVSSDKHLRLIMLCYCARRWGWNLAHAVAERGWFRVGGEPG